MAPKSVPLFLQQVWMLSRPYNAILPAIGIIIGWLAVAPDGTANSVVLVVLVAAYVLLHSGLTIWNDIEDEAIDDMPGRRGLQTLRSLGYIRKLKQLTSIMVISGLLLAVYAGLGALIVALGMVLCGYIYNARPLQLSRRPVASIAVLMIFYGSLPVLLGASYFGQTGLSLGLAAAYAVLRGSLSILKDYKDAPSDARHSKHTFLLVFGAKAVARVSVVAALIGYVAVIMLVLYSTQQVFWAVAATVVAVLLLIKRLELRGVKTYPELNLIFHQCLHYQIIFDGILVVWLAS